MELINIRSREMMKVIDADEHAVSIHIRRGDYLLPKFWANAGCVCQLPYYKNAIAELKKHDSTPSFYVFSDDIEWVKQNLSLSNAHYID